MEKSAEKPYPLGYRPALDLLRAIAIFAVVMYHGSRSDARFHGGYLGVELFFVLSGALITLLLLREIDQTGTVRLRTFYWRRALRLFPALLLMVLCTAGWVQWTQHSFSARLEEKIPAVLLYVSNLYGVFKTVSLPLEPWGHTWSLAQEEQFYLLWPLLLVQLVKKTSRRTTVFVLLSLLLTCTLLRAGLWAGGYTRHALYAPYARCDALLLGCLVGLSVHWGVPLWLQKLSDATFHSSILLLTAMFIFARGDSFMYYGGFSIAVLACANLVLVALTRDLAPVPYSPLLALGKISYGIYLWNWPLRALVPFSRFPIPFAAYVLLNVLAAVLSYYCLERPILRWRDRLRSEP